MQNPQKNTIFPIGLGAAALLLLSGCAAEDPAAPQETAGETAAQDQTAESAEGEAKPEAELAPGGAERLADEGIDPDEQGELVEDGVFSEEGDTRGINQMAQEQGEPVEVLAAPPHGPGPHEDLEVVGELTSEDQVRLGGREVRAAYADGSWVEVELADGYGWVQGHMLEGAVDPEGNPIN